MIHCCVFISIIDGYSTYPYTESLAFFISSFFSSAPQFSAVNAYFSLIWCCTQQHCSSLSIFCFLFDRLHLCSQIQHQLLLKLDRHDLIYKDISLIRFSVKAHLCSFFLLFFSTTRDLCFCSCSCVKLWTHAPFLGKNKEQLMTVSHTQKV